MSWLPRVSAATRERVAREFDDLGPAACTAEVVATLAANNPELLDIAAKWARDVGPAEKTMAAFAMFCRLLIRESASLDGGAELHPLPRLAPETRDLIVRSIDEQGVETFTLQAVSQLEEANPELLQMAHAFAARHDDYLSLMQGFALIYQSLAMQLSADRRRSH
jgi:hypothetical protein